MSVRNINKGYYDLSREATTVQLTFTGAATITVPCRFTVINGTVTCFIPTFSSMATVNAYLVTYIPAQFLPATSSLKYTTPSLMIVGNTQVPGVVAYNLISGQLMMFPSLDQTVVFTNGQSCGSFENITLTWNLI